MGWIKKLGEQLLKPTFWPHKEPVHLPSPALPSVDIAAQAVEEAAKKAAEEAAKKAAADLAEQERAEKYFSTDEEECTGPIKSAAAPTAEHLHQDALVSEHAEAHLG